MSSSKTVSVELSATERTSLSALQDLSNRDLWSSAVVANAGRRKATAHLVAHLAEIDRRELVYDEGYSSMYDFCVRGLGMSEGTAYRSIAGARAALSFPVVLSLLADGNLHLSGLSLLAPRLTRENHTALLEDAAGKTSAGIRVVLARWFPKPDVPDQVKPLRTGGKGPAPGVEPLSEGRFEVHFSAGESLKAKLEHAQNLMSHVSRELEVVIERALDALIRQLENKRWGVTDKPRRSRGTKPGDPGHAARREVYERDGAQCCFVSESGVRCTAKAYLQYDHIEATGIGGGDGASNGRVFCRSHNLNAAKKTFGREHVEDKIRLRQRRRSDSEDAEDAEAREKQDKLLLALTSQGFKKGEAKKATEKLAREARTLSLQELLRRALALLVPR
ncbi:MAG: hypothetical protein H6717_24005 [Polyangiaceae bacterium]|nr:hypothetical protein [Polyangiaceae bacterium]